MEKLKGVKYQACCSKQKWVHQRREGVSDVQVFDK